MPELKECGPTRIQEHSRYHHQQQDVGAYRFTGWNDLEGPKIEIIIFLFLKMNFRRN